MYKSLFSINTNRRSMSLSYNNIIPSGVKSLKGDIIREIKIRRNGQK